MKPSELADRLHRETLVIDTHADTILELWLHPEIDFAERNEATFDLDLPRLIESGIDVQVMAVGNGDSPASVLARRPARQAVPLAIAAGDTINGLAGVLECIDLVHQLAARFPDQLRVVTQVAQIEAARKAGPVGFLMSLESGLPSGATVSSLRAFYELGVRCVALSRYEHRVSDTEGGDLDPFAHELIREMDRMGMLIDVSHLLETGFWQTMETATGPVVDTHANAYALCPHPRNLKDDQLRALAERRGVIGVMAYRPHVHPTDPTLERMLDHIDYLVELLGPDHVGLGLDFDGMGGARQNAVLSDASEVPRITAGLLARGYDPSLIRQILGENWLRVFREVIG